MSVVFDDSDANDVFERRFRRFADVNDVSGVVLASFSDDSDSFEIAGLVFLNGCRFG